jgi:outer membrane protein assembly factor BamB
VQDLVIDPAAHVLMARSGNDPRTAFLDADTGDTLWRTAEPNSTVVALARGRALIRTDLSATATSLRMADARTGRVVWERTVDPTAELGPDTLFGEAPNRIVAVGATGSVTVLDWAGGAVLSQGDLHVQLTGPANPGLPLDVAVSTVGDRLYVSRRSLAGTSTTAYSTVPLTRLWTAAGGPVGQVYACGVVLCVTDTRWVSGIDPATGAVRWADPAWSTAFRWDATRLFAYDQQETPESALLDAATGAVVSRLGRTSPVGDLTLTADGRVPGRVVVGAGGHAVGAVDGVIPYGCVVRDRYLACPTAPGPTTVWRVP